MMKATLRSAVLLGLLVTSLPAFAEVQNLKVSGDVTVRAFHRENLDLVTGDGTFDDSEDFLMSTTGINIGADLTENVGTFVRIANERNWDSSNNASENASDFDLSQAYITLKELFYSPLTLRIGAQPIVWGRGFILGSNLLGGIILGGGDDRNAAISANEYTDFTAFDAIRATLDLSNIGGMALPLTADYVYIKTDENTIGDDDDVTIQGLNFSSHFDAASSEAEFYYLNKRDASATDATVLEASAEDGSVNTIGFRGSAKPVEGSLFYGELAYQWGNLGPDLEGGTTAATRGRSSGTAQQAWAANLGAEYTFAEVASTPKLGAEWRFYSGDDAQGRGAVLGWDPVAPGYFTTAIREFQTRSTVGGFYPNDQTNITSGQTNQHELGVYGGLNPLEDLRMNSRLSWFVMPVGAIPPGASPKRKRFLGTEWDTQLLYNYTDDVQFGLLYALFLPGNAFRDAGDGGTAGATTGDATPQQLVATVGVKF